MPWDGIAALINTAVTRIWPDKTQAQAAELQIALEQMKAEYENATQQIEVNKIEAANENVFVSGWRPFIGWVCGSSLLYKFILYPFIVFLCALFHWPIDISIIPVISVSELMPLLLGMLGLSYHRTEEKKAGIETKSFKKDK